jgi:hypothetical protein
MRTPIPPPIRRRSERRPAPQTSATHLTRGTAIEFIASRDRRPQDTERGCRDRTAQLVDGAIRSGDLSFSHPAGLPTAEVVAWARTKAALKSKFPDFPVVAAAISDKPATGFGTPQAIPTPPVPSSLSECQDALRDAYTEARRQEIELSRLRRENDTLRPLAEGQIARTLSNRRSASKPRHRR